MESNTPQPPEKEEIRPTELKRFVRRRVILLIAVSLILLWLVSTVIGYLYQPPRRRPATEPAKQAARTQEPLEAVAPAPSDTVGPGEEAPEGAAAGEQPHTAPKAPIVADRETEGTLQEPLPHPEGVAPPSAGEQAAAADAAHAEPKAPGIKGVALLEAMIAPLESELKERFWGWRPNDIINVTDNVNSFQEGVLEVTRRSSIILAERISRTGATAAFNPHLERAMNWFMIKADKYWFPSAESKYNDGLDELRAFLEKLKNGEAVIYTRTDNLIPLLAAYEDLLGSCEENLVKKTEDDGTPVSFFKVDDYFYYTKGVATVMLGLLEAIRIDFRETIASRRGMEVLDHAIESCHHAVEIDPWIVMNSSPGSIFANHRSNMAAPIGHARFYLGVLVKTLST